METREWDLLKLFEDRHIVLHGATVHCVNSNLHRGTNEAEQSSSLEIAVSGRHEDIAPFSCSNEFGLV